MLETLILIAWGDRSNSINQLFTALAGVIILSQIIRAFRFWLSVRTWQNHFFAAKLEYEREGELEISVSLKELIPPQNAHSRLWTITPPILTMFGLLGTFIGLTLALAVIPFGGDSSAIQAGVKEALPSMGSAFWTSLSALVASLVVRLTTLGLDHYFRVNVYGEISVARPEMIRKIERLTFNQNREGALLRPHSLREIMWQHNLNQNQLIGRLGSEIASAIRELPHFMPQGRHDEFDDALDQVEFSSPEEIVLIEPSISQLDSLNEAKEVELKKVSLPSSKETLVEIQAQLDQQSELFKTLIDLQKQTLNVLQRAVDSSSLPKPAQEYSVQSTGTSSETLPMTALDLPMDESSPSESSQVDVSQVDVSES